MTPTCVRYPIVRSARPDMTSMDQTNGVKHASFRLYRPCRTRHAPDNCGNGGTPATDRILDCFHRCPESWPLTGPGLFAPMSADQIRRWAEFPAPTIQAADGQESAAFPEKSSSAPCGTLPGLGRVGYEEIPYAFSKQQAWGVPAVRRRALAERTGHEPAVLCTRADSARRAGSAGKVAQRI
jgi:hypothetical protein